MKKFKNRAHHALRRLTVFLTKAPALKRGNLALTRFLATCGIGSPLALDASSEYWESQGLDTHHSPKLYLKPDETTAAVLSEFIDLLPKDAGFFEVGCNSGRNLKYLYDHGFRKLAGVEINRPAIEECMKVELPEVYHSGKYYIGNAADAIQEVPSESYDVVFSNAVLVHIAPKDAHLFKHMARVSRKYISIFTEQNPSYGWPHDYERIFSNLGYTQVLYRMYYADGRDHCRLPTEKFDSKKHYYDQPMLRIFVKNTS